MKTDGTNILLAEEELKFYFTYNEFARNYPTHLQKWLELQAPNGTEQDFKEEYIYIYDLFFYIGDFNEINTDGFFCIYRDNKRFIDISVYKEYLSKEADEYLDAGKDPAQVLNNKDEVIQYDPYCFIHETAQVLNTFFTWNAKAQAIVFDKYRYKRFTENVRSIVEFLYSEGQTLPTPVPEPQPQVGATAFTSSYPAPTQPPQPQPPQPTAPPETAPPPAPEELSPLQWKGTKIELVELAKALEVSGIIECEKDIFKNIICTLEKAFNFKVEYSYKMANDIKNRNNGSEAKFLDKLKNSYYENWVSKEDKRRRN